MRKYRNPILLALAVLAVLAAGCSKNAYLERNVDYVADDILIEQEEVLKQDLAKVKALYDEAQGSGELMAIEGAKAQYLDYQEKYKIVVDELKSRFGKDGWEQAVAAKRAKKAEDKAVKAEEAAKAKPKPTGMAALEQEVERPVDLDNPGPVVTKPFPAMPDQEPVAKSKPAESPTSAEPAEPVEPAASVSADAGGVSGNYVVAKGDNLSAIAARFKVTGEAIMRANGMTDPDKLAAGQTIVIPGVDQALPEAGASSEPAGSGPAPAASAPETYAVKSGDTLKAIAIRFGVNSKTLMEINGMTDPDKLAAGQTLRLR